MKRVTLLGARVGFAGFALLASLYCLLAYLPFTYHQIHAGALIGWVGTFARIHPWLNLSMLAVAIPLVTEPWRRGGLARWLTAGFLACQIVFGGAFLLRPVLPGLENNFSSFTWSLVLLMPVAWLAAIDIASYTGQVQWREKASGQGASHIAACCGAVFVSTLYAVVSFLRHARGLAPKEAALALGWSVLTHLLVFLGAFLLLDCVAGLAGLFRKPAQVEFWICHLLVAAGIAYGLQTLVWPSLGFDGPAAITFSVLLGILLAALNTGVAVWLAAGREITDGIVAAASPATLGLIASWRSGAVAALVLGAMGGALAVQSGALDWNYLLQKLTAAGIWLASFACFYAIAACRARTRSTAWLIAPLALLAAYKGLEAADAGAGPILERWAGYDASFQLARQFLTPPRRENGSFFQFLNRNTNIAASVHVDPVPVELVSDLSLAPNARPHIFIFTIDSLRRDYLSPYNPAVEFTPSIAAFARESTVFSNAFTRYGGTGLSEPAIWAGALLLHKQYITPFAPMNSLEKLVNADQYQVFLSRDEVLDSILKPSPAAVQLDPVGETMGLDFARTLDTLKQQIDRRGPAAPPIFAYTQPQNLHVAVIHRDGGSTVTDGNFAGFHAPYASRVKRIDAAFGSFIEFLKARGLYEHSIIVLTADHGDSLGEEGRWGHAYTLFPEIVRVPLLVHLPDELRGKVSSDPEGLAFSTDITPSLYYLLGHRPIQKNPLFGSPLFTDSATGRQRDPQAAYLLASSYAAVYGILSNGGRRLYIADGVNYQNYLFDINGLSAENRLVNPQAQQENEALIRSGILSINRFYRFGEGGAE